MKAFDDYTTESMVRALIALQDVRASDTAEAMYRVLIGNSVRSFTAAGIARMRGEYLALDLHHARNEVRP